MHVRLKSLPGVSDASITEVLLFLTLVDVWFTCKGLANMAGGVMMTAPQSLT